MQGEGLRDPKKRVVGARETLKKVLAGAASRVWVAKDAHLHVVGEVLRLCEERAVPVDYVETMKELGELCGIEVSAACAALTSRRVVQSEGG